MNTEEAIKDIQECVLPNVGGKSLRIAIEALEKQIPKKPELKPVDGFESEVASSLCCPTCKNPVVNYWCKRINPPHCMMCGQALDWSD